MTAWSACPTVREMLHVRSRASILLPVSTLTVVAIGVLVPYSPLAPVLGFQALPVGFLAALAVMIVSYLVLIELGKRRFYRERIVAPPLARATAAPRAGRSRTAALGLGSDGLPQ